MMDRTSREFKFQQKEEFIARVRDRERFYNLQPEQTYDYALMLHAIHYKDSVDSRLIYKVFNPNRKPNNKNLYHESP